MQRIQKRVILCFLKLLKIVLFYRMLTGICTCGKFNFLWQNILKFLAKIRQTLLTYISIFHGNIQNLSGFSCIMPYVVFYKNVRYVGWGDIFTKFVHPHTYTLIYTYMSPIFQKQTKRMYFVQFELSLYIFCLNVDTKRSKHKQNGVVLGNCTEFVVRNH